MYLARLNSSMMKSFKTGLWAVLALLAFSACKKDDDGGVEVTPPRDFVEVQTESDALFQTYLKSHFYNYEEFASPPENFNYKIKFDSIEGDNKDKTALWDQVTTKKLVRSDIEFKLYILKAREGTGDKPHFSDSTYVMYAGNVPYKEVFDFSATPVWFDLSDAAPAAQIAFDQRPNALDGFANSLNEFRGASSTFQNEDGTTSYSNDYGIGAVFIPTGLGYYNSGSGQIRAYDNLIFTFDLIAVNETDHDGDGIPSYLEDINKNFLVRDIGDNTDGDQLPNYLDSDDDGDGVPTRNEIEIKEDGSIIYTDTDGDGVPNYLDDDDDGDGILTKDEIEINRNTGEITYPDTNGNGTPDYLDKTS